VVSIPRDARGGRERNGRGGGKEGSDKASKTSGVTVVANGSPARGDIGIESVYARQVLEEKDRERAGGGEREGKRNAREGIHAPGEQGEKMEKKRDRARERREGGKGRMRARARWRGANQTVHFANSPTFWFAAMERHYLQRSLW